MNKEVLIAIAIGIGLSASCGFRVFVPMLIASLAAKTGLFPLNESFQWLSGWPAIISFGTASVVEILAYYIPLIDNLLDTITTPLAVGAGTLLLTSVLPVDSDFLKWVTGFIFGGGTAAAVQSGTVLTRLASTKFTAGTGNAIVATGEHAAAFGTSVLSLFIPFIIAALVLFLIIFIFMKFGKKVFRKKTKYAEQW
jgi:large-conductance mechanosensitive channel